MTKRALLSVVLGAIIILAGAGLLIKALFSGAGEVSAVQVLSFPNGDVYLNGSKVGETPYKNEKLSPGEYTLKLVSGSMIWEGKIKLLKDTMTYVNRELGEGKDNSAGQTLTLDKLADTKVMEIAAVSDPDAAIFKLDGKSVGTTPVSVSDVTAGDHEIAFSFPQYRDLFFRAKVMPGFRLNISAQLARSPQDGTVTLVTPTPTPATTSASTITPPYVTIKSTPTGWLRVRFAPSVSATESGRVNPGEKYPLLDEKPGWVKIKFKEVLEGWVSDSYVTKVK